MDGIDFRERPTPPSHLRPETRQWWDSVVDEFELSDHHLKLLQAAAEAWDEYQIARSAIQQHGMTFTDKHGQPRERPEVSIARQARVAFMRALRELGLDHVDVPENRPPRIGGQRW